MRRLLILLALVLTPSLAFAQTNVNITATDSSTGARVRQVGDDANDSIRVTIVSGAGSGGTASVDNSAFTFGTTNLTPSGFVFDDTAPNAATENRIAAPRMSGNRIAYGILRDAAGNERGANVTAGNRLTTSATIDAALPAGDADIGNVDLELAGTAVGQTNPVAVRFSDGTNFVTPASDVTEDAAETPGGTGPSILGVRRDAAASSAGASGDHATVNTDALGLLWSRQLDPCSGVAKLYHVVNMSTAATVEIANAVASQFWHICSVVLNNTGAQTIAIGEDDTDGCGSITAGLHGGATAATGWSFAANGGITLGNGTGTVMKSATANRYLCVITGQATQISGTIAYVSAP